jgi:Flp pilus assembly protein TadB
MIGALAAGVAVAAGAPWPLGAVLAVSIRNPVLGLAGVGAWLLTNGERTMANSIDARFCQAVAAELRGGVSLRLALMHASVELDAHTLNRACATGRPFHELAGHVEVLLPAVGRAAGAAVRLAGESGGLVADAFDAIAVIATDEEHLRNERRGATIQARASATIIAALPVLLFGVLVATGRLGLLAGGGPISAWFMVGGLGLLGAGLLVIAGMVRRAERR